MNDGKVDAMEMFERYSNGAELSPKTRKSWKAKLKSLLDFVGHDDLARLTTKDVIGWKDAMIASVQVQRLRFLHRGGNCESGPRVRCRRSIRPPDFCHLTTAGSSPFVSFWLSTRT